MKKYFVVFAALILSAISTSAQDDGVTWGMVKKSVEDNDADILNPKKETNPKTWIERERVYTRLYTFDISGIYLGMGENDLAIIKGQPKKKTTQGEYTIFSYDRLDLYLKDGKLDKIKRVDQLREEPLLTSFEALKKAYELDVDKKQTKKIVQRLTEIKSEAYMRSVGGQYFADNNYAKTLQYFETILAINAMPCINVVDSGLFGDCVIVNVQLYKQKKEQGDTLAALEQLKKSIDAYPGQAGQLITILINEYLEQGKDNLAIDYLNKAIASDPTNATYYFALGTLFDKIKDATKAIEAYKKAIDLDNNMLDSYLNLGALFYNTGIEYMNKANDPNNKTFKADEETAKDYYKKALPYLVKVKEIATDAKIKYNVLNTLKTIYYRLEMTAEYKAAKAELDAIK